MARIERRTVLQFAALAAATPWVVNVLRTESAAAGNPEVAAPSPGVDAAFAFLDGLVPLAPPVLPGAPAPVASRALPRSYSRGYLESIGFDVARRVRAGTYGINQYTMDFVAPFGGFKASGLGREFGREGLEHYIEFKTIVPAGSGIAAAG